MLVEVFNDDAMFGILVWSGNPNLLGLSDKV